MASTQEIIAKTPPSAPDRLHLRRFTLADQRDVSRMHSDPRVRELLVDDVPLNDPPYAAVFLTRLMRFYDDHPGLGIWAAERWVCALTPDHPDYPDAVQSLSAPCVARLLSPQPSFAGWFNLMPMSAQPEEVELGCRLMPEVWGGGLAMDGGSLLLDHAFDLLGRSRVWGVCHPRHRSVQLRLHMLGFEHHGERPYEGVQASHFVVCARAWRHQREQPLAQRRRMAMAWLKHRDLG